MKYLKKYKLFESNFLEFKEIVSTIKDICQEFEDNNCHCDIEPKDDIKLNILSKKKRGYFNGTIVKFYVDINIDRRICQDVKRSGSILYPVSLPEWFIETCKRIDDFMESEGFRTSPSINYLGGSWENFLYIEDLNDCVGYINKVRLDFIPYSKPIDESFSNELEIIQDLKDICLDINDLPKWRADVSIFKEKINAVIKLSKNESDDIDETSGVNINSDVCNAIYRMVRYMRELGFSYEIKWGDFMDYITIDVLIDIEEIELYPTEKIIVEFERDYWKRNK
jgi:hypothetical protein